jgi:predicted ribosome quality control (RQC) complex YloA/Tae2 family protein
VQQCDTYSAETDLLTLEEIRDELVQQQYLAASEYRRPVVTETPFHRYQTPSGGELLIGRNNRQNDQLSFRLASPYDLWFHSQEIPGSHVLLRLEAGVSPSDADLQFAADLAAYYCQARQSAQVPVVYTEPKHVYKPKGAAPGMVIYKHEQVIWGRPQMGAEVVAGSDAKS